MVENLLLNKTDNALLHVITDASGKRVAVCDGFSQGCNSCCRLGHWTCPENGLQPPCIAEAIRRLETSDYPISSEKSYP